MRTAYTLRLFHVHIYIYYIGVSRDIPYPISHIPYPMSLIADPLTWRIIRRPYPNCPS